jgi:hypothetical protein
VKQFKNLHMGLIILAFLVTVGLLFGGRVLTTKFKVEGPLARDLHRIKAISDFKLKQERDGITVAFKLQKVGNLQQVLDYVQQKVFLYYNQPVKTFKIVDRRNHSLEELRYQLSFYLEEAIVSGHYIQLKTAMDSYRGVIVKVYFDPSNLYLQLEKGSNYLYEVLPIPTNMQRPMRASSITGGDSA